MPHLRTLSFCAVLSATLAFCLCAVAQTLERRPPAPPASPPPAQLAVPKTAPGAVQTQQADEPPVIPSGTSLQVETTQSYSMRPGEAIAARLLHPLFVGNTLAVPAQTVLHGHVVGLQPDNKTRWQARLHGDFTPFHSAEVQFDELELPTGPVPLAAAIASRGAPVIFLSTAGAVQRQSLVAHQWAQVNRRMHDQIAFFTAPGRGDRALQILYRQLPYHPERIDAHTSWSFELIEPIALPQSAADPPEPPPATAPRKPETWSIRAQLLSSVSSATAKPGDPVEATVIEPVFDHQHQLVVPQGSTLIGKVTTAKAAGWLGHNGKLRFAFQELRFPEGAKREIQGSLAGAVTDKNQNLSLDAEGTVTPRNQASAIAPLLLTMLAGRALDEDGSMTADTGVASNGFGLVGRIVGIVASDRNLAAGIGYYAAGLSFYENFLHPGRDVVFSKDTRIEIETTPLRTSVLRPHGQ